MSNENNYELNGTFNQIVQAQKFIEQEYSQEHLSQQDVTGMKALINYHILVGSEPAEQTTEPV